MMDADNPRWRQYKRSLRKYPDVRDCLIREEQDKPEPDLRLMDWSRVGTGKGAEVCVFLIARSLGDVELIYMWLEYHEFQVCSIERKFSNKYVSRFDTQPMMSIYASWTIEQYRTVNPSWFLSLTGFEYLLSYHLNIGLTEAHQVVGVNVDTPSK